MDFSLSKQEQLFLQMISEFAGERGKTSGGRSGRIREIPDGNRSKNGKTRYYGYPVPG